MAYADGGLRNGLDANCGRTIRNHLEVLRKVAWEHLASAKFTHDDVAHRA